MRVERTEKPWGYELLVAHTEYYASKILFIRAGRRLSLQHHARKDKTLFLLEGEVAGSYTRASTGNVTTR